MRRVFIFGLVSLGLLFSSAIWADHHADNPTISIGYQVNVKAGQGRAMADGIKEFLAFRAENNDPMNWAVFQVVGGEDVGDFIFYSGNHRWGDMDAYNDWEAGAEAGAMWSALTSEHAWDVDNWIDTDMPDLSRWPEDEGYTLFWVTTYNLKVGMGQQWDAAVKKYHEAVVATNYDAHYSISSGELPNAGTRTIVSPYKSWGDMEDPEESIFAMLSKHYGEEEAAQLFADFTSTFDSSKGMVVRLRDDLMPEGDD